MYWFHGTIVIIIISILSQFFVMHNSFFDYYFDTKVIEKAKIMVAQDITVGYGGEYFKNQKIYKYKKKLKKI
jgi:hypothetical protein